MSAALTLQLLGVPLIALDDQPLTALPSRAAEALLIYVAYTGRAHARDVLAELLWSERDQKQALANLRSILSSLRRHLKPFLEISRQTVAINGNGDYWLDVVAFEEQIEATGDELGADAPLTPETVSRLEAALALYRGDFLEGFSLRSGRGFEEWALVQRERLRRQAHTALFRLVQHHLAEGNTAAGIHYAERLLALDPFDERARRAMMWLLARNNQHNAALRHYDALHDLLAQELGVAPTAETATLYERIRTARARPRHNLPPAATTFIGRERELQALRDKLADPDCRLLTILGPGGIGKTRLLLEFGRQMGEGLPIRFLHGVRYVSLAHLTAPHRLPAAVAEALGLTASGANPQTALLDYLREKEMLLLLDNFEHLLDDFEHAPDNSERRVDSETDLVTAILREAPHVTIVTTSRKRLQFREEWIFDLGGLPAPPTGWGEESESELAEMAASFPAVALFLQSARRASRHFCRSAADLRAIAAVCRRLDGLPLGIELAAAWIRHFSPEAICGQIEADLDFLSTSARNAPARHRSLRAVLEHSWQMLDGGEQAAASSLSVFQGAFTAGAAQRVAGAHPRLLASLVDKSFLRHSRPSRRYEMHQLLREYAGEQLAAHPQQEQQARHAHARHFAHFVHERADAVKGTGQQQAYREIGAVIDEIRAAWEWDLECGRFDNVARSLEGLFYFYWARGWLHEGATAAGRLAQAVAALAPDDRLLLAQAQMWQGEFYGWLGRYDEALALLQKAEAICRDLDDKSGLTFALNSLGRVHFWQGDYAQASDAFQNCLALARALQDDHWIALALNSLAVNIAEVEADYDRAWSYLEESLVACRRIGDQLGAARALVNMGSMAQEQGRYGEARRLFEESLAIYREAEYEHGIASALNYLGQVNTFSGDYERARALIQEAHDLNRDSGHRWAIADSLRQMGNLARDVGELAGAKHHYDAALRLTQEIGAERATLSTLLEVAALSVAAGDPGLGLTLSAFILRRPEGGRELLRAAERLFDKVKEGVAPAAVERYREEGEALGLDEAIGRLLVWAPARKVQKR